MWAPSTIGIDNNFSSSETGISSWTSDIELSRWVDDDLGVFEHISWHDFVDDLLGESLLDGFIIDIRGVLSGNENVVNSGWFDHTLFSFFILNNNLRFAVWSQPWDLTVLSLDGHDLAELVSENMRVWVENLSVPLISGISEHKSLISGSHIGFVLGFVHSSGNVGILCVNVNNDLAVVAIKSDILTGESNLSADLSGNLLEVNFVFVDRDLSKKNNLNFIQKLEHFDRFFILTIPVLVAVSIATLALGSTLRQASRIPSET